jgi:hypothetical protein
MSFSRRDLFWFCAGIAAVLVILLLVHALNGSQNPAPASVGSHSAPMPSPQAAGSMDEMLSRLEARLAAQGGTDADWELLAQTYDFIGRTDDAKLARAHQLSPSAMTAAAPEPAATSAAAVISGQVEVAAALKAQVTDGLTLFIVAKAVDSPGPPVAIVRSTTGHWPLAFTLDDSNSMVPGRNLSATQRVSIEARVSRSGMAAPQPGDLQSAITTIDPHQSTPVRIVIDHVIG